MNPYQENSFFFVGVICPCGRLKVNSNTQGNYGNRRGMKSIVIADDGTPSVHLLSGPTHTRRVTTNVTMRDSHSSTDVLSERHQLDLAQPGSKLNLSFR